MREIHDDSSPDQWRYIPTKLNPTDKGTRGGMDPRFYRKVKSSGQKGSLEKPQKLTIKFSGLVRVVDVRTGGSEKRRLSPLEAEGLSMSTLVMLLIYAFLWTLNSFWKHLNCVLSFWFLVSLN